MVIHHSGSFVWQADQRKGGGEGVLALTTLTKMKTQKVEMPTTRNSHKRYQLLSISEVRL